MKVGGFIAAALVILLIPGPAVLYLVTRSLAQGRRAGFVSVLGLSTGALVHVAAATVGLSAILVASSTAFNIVTDGMYVLLASGLRHWLGAVVRGSLPQYASGAIYIGLGVTTALSGRRN